MYMYMYLDFIHHSVTMRYIIGHRTSSLNIETLDVPLAQLGFQASSDLENSVAKLSPFS